MKNSRFKTVKVVKSFNIPLELNEQALSEWLQGVVALPQSESIEKLFFLSGSLNQLEISASERLSFLTLIRTYLLVIVDKIEKQRSDLSFPLSNNELIIREFIVWSHLNLAAEFHRVGKAVDGKKSKVSCWCLAFFALSQALLHISAVYNLPGKGFWRLCYQIYDSALDADVLLIPSEIKEQGELSISEQFKQILLFSLSGSNQYRAGEMKTIFQFLGRYACQLQIEKNISEDRMKGGVAFDLAEDEAPQPIPSLEKYSSKESLKFISSVDLAKQIYQDIQLEQKQTGAIKSINKTLFMRLIKTLGNGVARKSTRIEDMRHCQGIVGFDLMSSYLRTKSGETKIVPQKYQQPERLELLEKNDVYTYDRKTIFKEDIEEDQKIQNIYQLSSQLSDDGAFWEKKDNNELIENVTLHKFDLINSSAQGYALASEDNKGKVKLSEIFGIISEDTNRLEIAIIRRISPSDNQSMTMGIEVIGFESEAILISKVNQKKQETHAILLPGIKALNQTDSVVFKTGEYALGEYITIKRNNSYRNCRLKKFLNVTQSITHAELFTVTEG